MTVIRLATSLAMLTVLAACAAPSPGRPTASEVGALAAPQEPRTLNVGLEREPPTLGLRPLRETFAANYFPNRTFNADFAYLDDQGAPQPYMVEALPQLNADTWRVFPDGRMETTYRFLPNLVWQDGIPFSAEDYVFGWQVYSHPDMGLNRTAPFDGVDDVVAGDPRTLVITWKRPYPDAGHMAGRDRQLPALPRHLLQSAFESESADTFTNLSYWTRDYIGLGPFKLTRWEPGAFIEASAFDLHARGKAKIERMKISFLRDRNTALANALSGEVDILADNAIQYQDAQTLRREWSASTPAGGTVI